jgi:hypothetical protein
MDILLLKQVKPNLDKRVRQYQPKIFTMNRLIPFILILFYPACSKTKGPVPVDTIGQNIPLLVQPIQTDAGYSSTDQAHYVVRNTKTHINKLLLFIGGSFSIPKDYNYVCDHGATIGLDVISLSYPNNTATAPLGVSSDPFIFDNYRDELVFGNQVSNVVAVDVLNCIETRATKLVVYLKNTYPDQNWVQYLTASNTLMWNKIIVAGHSQGSGHACYTGKKKLVDRVVMFSGPNDYSTFFNAAGHWLTITGVTPLDKHYSLLHTQDEIVPFSYQVANLRGLGLLGSTGNPTPVDNLVSPYTNAHSLSLSIPAMSYHSAPVGFNPKLPGIWTYMFTSP